MRRFYERMKERIVESLPFVEMTMDEYDTLIETCENKSKFYAEEVDGLKTKKIFRGKEIKIFEVK